MKDEMVDQLLASVREGAEILQGQASPSRTFILEAPDIKRLRATYKLSQTQFAALLGISAATLRNWEQSRRTQKGQPVYYYRLLLSILKCCWTISLAASKFPTGKLPLRKRANKTVATR